MRPLLLSVIACAIYVCPGTLVAGKQILLQESEPGQGSAPILDDDFAAWIEETGKGWGMKGIAVAVTRKNKEGEGWTTETKGYGVADRWGNPVDDESLFSIGSNSKLFTALALGTLTLNESVPIDWNTKVKDILPQSVWDLQDEIAEGRANVVDILSHRTGLPRHDLSYSSGESVETSLSKLRYLRPSAEFREIFQYNNQMYTLASHIVSRFAKSPFATYVTRKIISPLGLSTTTYNVTFAEESGKLAQGFVSTGKDEKKGEGRQKLRFRPIPYWDKEGSRALIAGAGGVISNAKDMAIWLQALLLSGRSPKSGETVIPASIVERVAQGVVSAAPVAPYPELSPIVYGMGQMRYTYQGHELIEHNGGTIGHYSSLTRFPHDGLGVAVLTNWEHGQFFMNVVKWKLIEKALGLQEIDWNERYHNTAEQVASKNPQQKPRPLQDKHHSSVPYYDLAGIYFNPAYGTLSLCAYPPPKNGPSLKTECDDLVSEARSTLRPLLNDSVPALLATWPKVWSTHLLLQHSSGDHFTGSPAYVFPAPFPNASDTQSASDDEGRPFATIFEDMSWKAQFIVGQGFRGLSKKVEGMAWTGVWGPGNGVKGPKGKGKEGAEVWFDRVA